jgi:hypothetical protein
MDDDDDIGLYDSDTGESLHAIGAVEFGHSADGDRLHVMYAKAKRGMIAQIRVGDGMRCHFFADESMMDEDADRIGRWLEMDGKDAVRIIRERAPAMAQ